MRKCARCGAENSDDRSACSKCLAPLEDGQAASSGARAPTGPAQPRQPAQPRRVPAQSVGASSTPQVTQPVPPVVQPPGAARQPPPGPSPHPAWHQARPYPDYPPVEYPRYGPARTSSSGIAFVIAAVIVVLLAAAGFAIWKSMPRHEPGPVDGVREFFDAIYARDHHRLMKSLSKASLQKPGLEDELTQALGAMSSPVFGPKPVEGKHYVLELASSTEATARVQFKFGPQIMKELDKPNVPPEAKQLIKDVFGEGIPFIVVKEEAGWKVDLPQTETAGQELEKKLMQKLLGGAFPAPTITPPGGFPTPGGPTVPGLPAPATPGIPIPGLPR